MRFYIVPAAYTRTLEPTENSFGLAAAIYVPDYLPGGLRTGSREITPACCELPLQPATPAPGVGKANHTPEGEACTYICRHIQTSGVVSTNPRGVHGDVVGYRERSCICGRQHQGLNSAHMAPRQVPGIGMHTAAAAAIFTTSGAAAATTMADGAIRTATSIVRALLRDSTR